MDDESEVTGANVYLDTIVTALITNKANESTKQLINGSRAQFSDSLYVSQGRHD